MTATASLRLAAVSAAAVALAGASSASAQQAKNVFLMISDGAGFNHFNATAMYQYGGIGSLPYEQAGWTKYAATTYPLNLSGTPTNDLVQDPGLVYDASKAWDTSAASDLPSFTGIPGLTNSGLFEGYDFVKTTYTDSAAAGTAIATGKRTYNGSINIDNQGNPLQSIGEIAKANSLATGVVSSVYFSHATPATIGGAQNLSRNNYNAIANEMLSEGALELIMSPNNIGGGTYDRIGGLDTYTQLQNGTHPGGWTLLEDRASVDGLADGSIAPSQGPLIALTGDVSLQYTRPFSQDWNGNGVIDDNTASPFFPQTIDQLTERQMAPINPGDDSQGDPFNDNPTLASMTAAAINHLDAQQDSDGIFLMVEGSHVDWAGHGANTTRLIEEQVDFNNSIEAVMDWVMANDPNFEETLVIVTADHEAGMVWGPDSDTVAFDQIVDNGLGEKPGMRMNSTQHTNQLVPMYARGVGADLFAGLIEGTDTQYLDFYGMSGLDGWGNDYIGLTEMFTVMDAVIPEPSSAALLGLFGLAGLRRRRA
ncbi:MAG: alkaline phosphatase [Planctomycetota bacterium]